MKRDRDVDPADLALQPGLAVLDIGCGPGGYHDSITRAGVCGVGIDQSAGMAHEARAHRGTVARADAQALPFGDMAFDRVLAVHMLYHVSDRAAALREMRRMLRAGGRVVLATNGVPFLARMDGLHQGGFRDPTPTGCFVAELTGSE